MPRPICVACATEMTWVKPVTVQFDALSVMGAYQQWQGDLCECPTCKTQVVARYGSQASWAHYHQDKVKDAPFVTVRERNPLGNHDV
jgi:hypothetical protein